MSLTLTFNETTPCDLCDLRLAGKDYLAHKLEAHATILSQAWSERANFTPRATFVPVPCSAHKRASVKCNDCLTRDYERSADAEFAKTMDATATKSRADYMEQLAIAIKLGLITDPNLEEEGNTFTTLNNRPGSSSYQDWNRTYLPELSQGGNSTITAEDWAISNIISAHNLTQSRIGREFLTVWAEQNKAHDPIIATALKVRVLEHIETMHNYTARANAAMVNIPKIRDFGHEQTKRRDRTSGIEITVPRNPTIDPTTEDTLHQNYLDSLTLSNSRISLAAQHQSATSKIRKAERSGPDFPSTILDCWRRQKDILWSEYLLRKGSVWVKPLPPHTNNPSS